MHPLSVLLILVTAGASAVYGHPAAAGTTAARFWEKALPGTPMPEAIANLVQEGIDHSPLEEHYSMGSKGLPSAIVKIAYKPSVDDNFFAKYKPPATSSSDKAETVPLPPGVFFLQEQVNRGRTMTTLFEPSTVPPILPREVAQKAPFLNLADVLSTFHVAPSSGDAAVLGHTLSLCQSSPAAAGEQRACTTSLDGTVQSSMQMLDRRRNQGAVVWAASSAVPRAGMPLQPYVVEAVTELDGDRHVGCHSLPFPYAVYYCHSTGLPSKAYMVSLRGLRGGPPVTMATICHLDTSNWDPEHAAFKMLNTKPGGAPVCHFMSYASLLFGEKATVKP